MAASEPLDPLSLFELDFLPSRIARMRSLGPGFIPRISRTADLAAARARVEELKKRRLAAFGLADLTTGASRHGPPPLAKAGSLGP
jgi:hypothetical protein